MGNVLCRTGLGFIRHDSNLLDLQYFPATYHIIILFNYSSGGKMRKFQNDEVPAHGGSRELLGLNTCGRKISKFHNDEVRAHGGSREKLGLNTCGRKILKISK